MKGKGVTFVAPAHTDKGPSTLISRNEETMVQARRSYYEQVNKEKKNEQKLQLGQYIGELFF